MTPSRTVRADPRVADLVQAGRIRSALFLPQYTKEEGTGEIRGIGPGMVAIELLRGIAARLGVEVLLGGLQTPVEVVECLKTGACDMAFMGITEFRAAEVDFSPPVIQFDFTYLVPASSSIFGVADADRPGVRIAVVRNHASTIALSRIVRHAQLVATEIPEAALDMLRAGNADALASARDLLVDYSAKLPGSRVLKNAYGGNRTANQFARMCRGIFLNMYVVWCCARAYHRERRRHAIPIAAARPLAAARSRFRNSRTKGPDPRRI